MIFELQTFGSLLRLEIFGNIQGNRINEIFDTVLQFESKYSRFIKGNFLHTLNTQGSSEGDAEFLSLLRASFAVNKATSGYFDISLLPILENLGYGVSQEKYASIVGMENIVVENEKVTLKNGVQIDLGGIGKGYIIDKIYKKLELLSDDFIINFGGDIKVKGVKKIGLEDPLNDTKLLGEILIQNMSLCGSSGEKRKFGNSHHLINPKTLQSAQETLCVFTTHSLAMFADMYATALYVSPLSIALETLEKTTGLEALIITRTGEIYKSTGFEAILY